MSAKHPRTAWITGLAAVAIAADVITGTTAGALAGDQAGDGAYAFSAKIDVGGGKRACTGTLVDPRWVLSAASCFTDDPTQAQSLQAGAPSAPVAITVAGHVTGATELVPRQDRDLVMVRLTDPVFDIAPLAVATTAPAQGDTLRAAGFGRTKDSWVPDHLHTGAFTTDAPTVSTLPLTPAPGSGAALCRGDAGGPVLRESGGRSELVAVTSRSWQGGCLGESETRTGALATRADDLSDWFQQIRSRPSGASDEVGGFGRVRFADFDGDGKPDYISIADNGAVHVYLNRGGDGHGGWQDMGQVATGQSDLSRVRFADFDGDGRADFIQLSPNGPVQVYLNRGGDGHGGWQFIGQVATGQSDPSRSRFADFDGDGRADYILINPNGSIEVYLNRGGDGHGGWQYLGQIASGQSDPKRVQFADFDGDHKTDYALINPDGSIEVYLNRGGDGHGGWQYTGKITTGATTDPSRIYLTDLDGDGHADYLWNPGDGTTRAYRWTGGDGHGGWQYLGQIAQGA